LENCRWHYDTHVHAHTTKDEVFIFMQMLYNSVPDFYTCWKRYVQCFLLTSKAIAETMCNIANNQLTFT